MNNIQDENQKKSVGRPTVMTPETVGKLEEAFAIDATVKEACFYADIHPDTFYEYLKKNPEFSDRIEALRQKPILKARQTLVRSLDNPAEAKWYLEKKLKSEFGLKMEVETQTRISEKIGGAFLDETGKFMLVSKQMADALERDKEKERLVESQDAEPSSNSGNTAS